MSKKAWIILIVVVALGIYYYYSSSKPKWSYMLCETVMEDGKSCDEPAIILIDACISKEECIKYATKYLKYYPSFEIGRNCEKLKVVYGMVCEELCDRYGNCYK